MADPVTTPPVDPLIGEEPALPEPSDEGLDAARKAPAPKPEPEPEPEPAPEPAPEEPIEPQEPAEPTEPAVEPERSMDAPQAPAKKPGPWSRLRQLEDENKTYQQRFDAMQQEI